MNHETELSVGVDMSEKSGRLFKKEPAINVISKEDFEDRVHKVFELLGETLAKSFGPYGAPTIIYNHPYSHITKDGYTIMKNLSMDASETLVDQSIANMVDDICGRLNYSVGDGTTSAVIATNSIYQNYMKTREELLSNFVLPRDVISRYDKLKYKIIEELSKKVVEININDTDELKEMIKNVVYISSNGDEVITNYISELYAEIGIPAISCILSSDGQTRKEVIKGYRYDVTLNDKLYVNTSDMTMRLSDADLIMLSCKVTEEIYTNVLKPLTTMCAQRKRKLVVMAPIYDEVALKQVIAVDLNHEYTKTQNINMVLTTYKYNTEYNRRLAEDFATLMNTTIIDRTLIRSILDQIKTGSDVSNIFNIDNRNIDHSVKLAVNATEMNMKYYTEEDELEALVKNGYCKFNDCPDFKLIDQYIDLGFIKQAELGYKDLSLFTEFVYDENKYNLILKDAEDDLNEKINKYKKLGTFSLEVGRAQNRYFALKLKMGVIEVGGDSELSQKLLKDSVDDAVKAAASAFNNGVVLGCNTNLIQVLFDLREKEEDDINKILLNILINGYKDVYKTVLNNAFPNFIVRYDFDDKEFLNSAKPIESAIINAIKSEFDNEDVLKKIIDKNTVYDEDNDPSCTMGVHDLIIEYSILTNKVFDVSTLKYSDKVINSAKTDEEILTATIDLVSLLIVGNQLVVTQKHNFE